MSSRLKRWERQEVHQVTKAWVDQQRHRFTDRDMELLRLLLKRRLLRRDQIQVLHPGFRSLANPEVQINRRLRILFDYCFIDRAFPPVLPGEGSSQSVIALDRAGSIVLGTSFKRIIKHQKDLLGNTHRFLPNDYKHTLGINDFETSLINFCVSSGSELLRWRLEFENLRRFQYNGEKAIRPDGFGILKLRDGKGRAFFFEYDTGSEDIRSNKRFKTITEKFKSYAAYKSSGAWIHEDWAKVFRSFPDILFLTEDNKRVKPLREVAESIGIKFIIDHATNTDKVIDALTTSNPT